MNINNFKKIVPTICDADTCATPEDWKKENPIMGHCAIVSVLAQELFGGIIVRVSLQDTPYEKFKSHYLNIINGKEHDFTLSQFKSNPYLNKEKIEKNREYILSNPNTRKRFNLLKDRFNLKLTNINNNASKKLK